MTKPDEVSIKYIGKREPWHDRLYKTGLVFDCNQVRTIPWDMARKFLRHEDLFEKVDDDAKDKTDKASKKSEADKADDDSQASDDTQALLDEQEAKNKDRDDEQRELQDLYDQVSVMDKPALKDFAMTHYQQNTNNSKSVENIRLDVTAMIDQFGAP